MTISDKFKKGESLFATTLSTGISTGTGETITLASVTGLPTDTEITLTFNRIDGDGNVNETSEMERITGTIVGSALTSYTRGTDGSTEQAHSAGTVIEYIWNSQDLNDMVAGILVEHNQDGTHDRTGADSDLVSGTAGTDGNVAKWNADGDIVDGPPPTAAIEFVIDGAGAAITTGIKGDLEIPFACTIVSATALADQSGSIVVDIWNDAYADYPATDTESITASAPVTISTATKSQDTTLTGWTKAIEAGDTLRFNVDSCTTITRVTISLKVTRS